MAAIPAGCGDREIVQLSVAALDASQRLHIRPAERDQTWEIAENTPARWGYSRHMQAVSGNLNSVRLGAGRPGFPRHLCSAVNCVKLLLPLPCAPALQLTRGHGRLKKHRHGVRSVCVFGSDMWLHASRLWLALGTLGLVAAALISLGAHPLAGKIDRKVDERIQQNVVWQPDSPEAVAGEGLRQCPSCAESQAARHADLAPRCGSCRRRCPTPPPPRLPTLPLQSASGAARALMQPPSMSASASSISQTWWRCGWAPSPCW